MRNDHSEVMTCLIRARSRHVHTLKNVPRGDGAVQARLFHIDIAWMSRSAKALSEKGSGRGVISICAAGGLGVTAIMEAADA